MNKLSTDLEQLLSHPLPEVADEGFSRKVSDRIKYYRRIRSWLLVGISSLLIFVLIKFFPLLKWLSAITENTQTIGTNIKQQLTTSPLSASVTNFKSDMFLLTDPSVHPVAMITIISIVVIFMLSKQEN